MQQLVWLSIAFIGLSACGGDDSSTESELVSGQNSQESEYGSDDEWEEEYADDGELDTDPELGVLRIALAGEEHETHGYCSLLITRMPGSAVATIAANLTVGAFNEQSGDDIDFGELNFGWGINPDDGENPMGVNYEPPAPADLDVYDLGWVQDVENPDSASFAMTADGQPYAFDSGDLRGADNAANAPHLWQTGLAVQVNLVNPRDDGQVFRDNGKFNYEGLCTVSIKVINDE